MRIQEENREKNVTYNLKEIKRKSYQINTIIGLNSKEIFNSKCIE